MQRHKIISSKSQETYSFGLDKTAQTSRPYFISFVSVFFQKIKEIIVWL